MNFKTLYFQRMISRILVKEYLDKYNKTVRQSRIVETMFTVSMIPHT